MRLEDFELEHRKNIELLIGEFGEKRKSAIIARYFHQLHLSEENPNLNGELLRHTYQRTRETLRAEYNP